MSNEYTTKTKNAYTIATISVTLVLFILGVATYLLYGLNVVTDNMLDHVKVSVILKDKASKNSINALEKELLGKEYISKVVYISKDQALSDFNKYLGDDFTVNMGVNPLPASLEVYISDANNDLALNSVTSLVKTKKSIVDDVVHQGNLVQQVTKNIFLFKLVIVAFLLALLFVSVVTINNTIRMVVLSKRFLIKTMLLVGATRGFIRRPFIMQALGQGLLSGTIAIILVSILIYVVNNTIPELSLPLTDTVSLVMIPAMMLGFGMFICIFSTLISVNKYMRVDNNDLHVF